MNWEEVFLNTKLYNVELLKLLLLLLEISIEVLSFWKGV